MWRTLGKIHWPNTQQCACYNVVLCLVQKFHARNSWQTPIKATVAQLTCLETNRHLEGMSVNFLISPTSHVTCSFGLRFLSCIEETKMTGLRLKHAKCSASWKWPEAAGALLEVAQPCETSLSSGCRFLTTNATNPSLEPPFRNLEPQTPVPSTRPRQWNKNCPPGPC